MGCYNGAIADVADGPPLLSLPGDFSLLDVSFQRHLSGLRSRYLAHGNARPAYLEALRASALTAAPLFLAVAFDRPSLVWMGIAAWLVSQADVGGAYAIRAMAMGGVALGGTLACLLGWLAGSTIWTAVPLMLLVGGGLSLLRALGSTGKTAGTLLIVAFAIALATPVPDALTAAQQAMLFLCGGGLAAVVALAFWRVHPFKPVRQALGVCYAQLAEALDELRVLQAGASETDAWERLAQRTHRSLREQIETARKTLLATQLGRSADGRRGAQYGTLIEIADRAFESWIGLSEHLEAVVRQNPPTAAGGPLGPQLAMLHQQYAQLSETLSHSTHARSTPWAAAAPGPRPEAAGSPEAALALQRLKRLTHLANLAHEGNEALAADVPSAPAAPASPQRFAESFQEARRTLRAQLTLRSRAFRHALRVGVATALTLLLTHLLHLEQGAWVLIATLVILQPSVSETWVRGVQRVGGTALGGLLVVCLGLIAWPPSVYPLAIAGCLFLAMALRHLNYTYFILFVTPAFVLLAQLTRADWHLAVLRLDNTLLGVAIAVASLFLFWPTRERENVRSELARALEAERAFCSLLFRPLLGGERAPGEAFAERRRQIGLAITNAEDAVQRLLGERTLEEQVRAAYFTSTLYLRRMAASMITLLSLRERLEDGPAREELATFAREMERFLEAWASALRGASPIPEAGVPEFQSRLPDPEHPFDAADPIASENGWSIVERLGEQAAVLDGAFRRIEHHP